MKPYKLYREQTINADLQTCWKFFSSPGNLKHITPDDMGFAIISEPENKHIEKGMIIDYTVSPLFGIRLKWRTEISNVLAPYMFTDRQTKGPFKMWEHTHIFIQQDKNTLMIDLVEYQLPLGWFGRLFHSWLILPRLDSIFNYRQKVINKIFDIEAHHADFQTHPEFPKIIKTQVNA